MGIDSRSLATVGQPLPHDDGAGHVTGAAVYTDDLLGRFSHVLHAWPVQAPHAHARIVSIDSSEALAMPGVVDVLTKAAVPGENDTGAVRRDEPLFPDVVMYHGQAVAWVLAETEEAARHGAAAVRVAYEPLPAVLTIDDAIRGGHFLTEPLRVERGDAEAALREAPFQLSGELRTGAQEHFYLETHTTLAYVDEAGHLMVHASTQHPTDTQAVVARVLGLPRHQVIVQSLRMGGGFGGKESQANPYASVAALGAWRTRRPVRVRLDRSTDMVLTGKRHPFLGRFQVGFDGEGRLLALIMDLYADGGWSLDLSEAVLTRAMLHTDNAYYIPHVRVTGRVVRTNKGSNTAFRGFGGPQGMVMIEDVVDRVARALQLPPHVVRERNFYREGQAAPYGQTVEGVQRLHTIWNTLKQTSDFDARRAAIHAFNARSAVKKRGIAITPVKYGISFTASLFNQGSALVLIYLDGTVQVSHGGTEMGQGLHTKVRQIAAETLGVPLETVRIMPTRTDKVPNTSATAASTGSDLNGAAVADACRTLRSRLAHVAAQQLGVHPDDVVFHQGLIHPLGEPERSIAFEEAVNAAYAQRVPLFATGYYRTPGVHFDADKGQGRPFHYYVFGAAVSEVEVDGLTGEHRLLRVDIFHDVGESINPLVDLGQVEGGFAQGVGWLTREEVVWDGEGRLATRGPSTYKLPALSDIPEEFHVSFLPRSPQPGVIFGSKAVGEPPLMLAISVREAIRDAVAAFRPALEEPGLDGHKEALAGPREDRIVELAAPSTPEAVYWAIERARRGAGGGDRQHAAVEGSTSV